MLSKFGLPRSANWLINSAAFRFCSLAGHGVLRTRCASAAQFQTFDWTTPELLELQILFLRAARVVDDRSLDLPMPLRSLIASKLEKSGVPALQTAKIKGFVPIGRSDRASLYDESLPPGLILID